MDNEIPTQIASEADAFTHDDDSFNSSTYVNIVLTSNEKKQSFPVHDHNRSSSVSTVLTEKNKVTPNKSTLSSTGRVLASDSKAQLYTSNQNNDKKRKYHPDHDTSRAYGENLRLSEITTQTKEKSKHWFPKAKEIFDNKVKANINTVSFDGIKRVSYENEQQNLEIDISPDNYCQDCGQLHEHCHLKVHGNYIKKKIFTTYRDKSELCGTDHILSSIQEAYNESRRVDYCNRFRFYDATDENVPGCVQRLACKLVSNVQELRQASIINREIKNGIVQLIRAKRFRRA